MWVISHFFKVYHFCFFHSILENIKKHKLINIINIVNLPPGAGKYENQIIQEEKYFSCTAKSPKSFCAIVPKNTKSISHDTVYVNNWGFLRNFTIE